VNTRKSLRKTERWQIVLEPWCWPYGENEAPYGVGYIDRDQLEPWEILAEREQIMHNLARLIRKSKSK
jgi:hypothetical protein